MIIDNEDLGGPLRVPLEKESHHRGAEEDEITERINCFARSRPLGEKKTDGNTDVEGTLGAKPLIELKNS